MIPFIQVTDSNGYPGYIKASNVEATTVEPETGFTRVFVCTGGFYRIKDSQEAVLAKLRDIETVRELEEKQ